MLGHMDMERTMQFIVETLADVAVRQQEAEVRAKKAEARADRADARLDKIERQMKGIQTLVKIGMRGIIELREMQKRAQVEMREMRESMKNLSERQKRTDERFDRWLDSMNKGSNGHKKKPN